MCLSPLLFTLLVRERSSSEGHGDSGIHDTWHWTDETASGSLVVCTHSRGEEDTAQGHVGGHNWEQSEQPGAVGGKLYSIEGMGWPLVPTEGCDLLVNSMYWQRTKTCFSGISRICVFSRGTLSVEAELGGRLGIEPSGALPISGSRQHIILDFSFRPYISWGKRDTWNVPFQCRVMLVQ